MKSRSTAVILIGLTTLTLLALPDYSFAGSALGANTHGPSLAPASVEGAEGVSPAKPEMPPPMMGKMMMPGKCCCMMGGSLGMCGPKDKPMPGACFKMMKKMKGKMMMGGKGDHMGIETFLKHAQALDLSGEQVEKLKKLAYDTKMEMIDMKAALAKAKLKLNKMIHSDNPSLSAIKRQLDVVAKARVSMEYKKISSMLAAKGLLTKEQREKLKQSMHSTLLEPEEGDINVSVEVVGGDEDQEAAIKVITTEEEEED